MRLTYSDHQITANFHVREFHCKDGTQVPEKYLKNAIYIAKQLQKIREKLLLGSIVINSSYRSESYNRKVGGAINSNHLTASAVDITQQKFENHQFAKKIRELINDGIIPDGEVLEYGTFVHYAPNYHPKFDNLNLLTYNPSQLPF